MPSSAWLRVPVAIVITAALAGCGSDDSAPSKPAAASPASTTGSPSAAQLDPPQVQAGRIVEVQYADAFALWKIRLAEQGGGRVTTTWKAAETGEAEWEATATVQNAKGERKTGRWLLALPLDRKPTAQEMERADRQDSVKPVDRGGRDLSRFPPASPPEGDLSVVAMLSVQDDDTFLASVTPGEAAGDLLVDDGVIDEAMLRGIGVTGTTGAPVQGVADIDGSTRIVSGAGSPKTVAALADRARRAEPMMIVRLTWSGKDAEPGTIEDLLSLPVERVELLDR